MFLATFRALRTMGWYEYVIVVALAIFFSAFTILLSRRFIKRHKLVVKHESVVIGLIAYFILGLCFMLPLWRAVDMPFYLYYSCIALMFVVDYVIYQYIYLKGTIWSECLHFKTFTIGFAYLTTAILSSLALFLVMMITS